MVRYNNHFNLSIGSLYSDYSAIMSHYVFPYVYFKKHLRDRETGRVSACFFTPQMPAVARTERGHNRELEIQCRMYMRVAVTQLFEQLPTASWVCNSRKLELGVRSWNQIKALRCKM